MKKICVVTGSRAEYGLLKPLMDEIKNDADMTLQIAVTGAHLSEDFGLTYREIEEDGFVIDEKVDILLDSDSPVGVANCVGLGVLGFSRAYERLKPDLVTVLGDRYEILGAVIPALIMRIPIAHIHGGELTEGVFDDAIRHSITKMSQFHFTSTESYRQRVIQLGEQPERVSNVGALGIDNIRTLKLLTKEDCEQSLRRQFSQKNLLVTFHPVTLENNTSQEQFGHLLDALESLDDTLIVFTKANADTHGRVINQMIDAHVKRHPHDSVAFTSMGQLNYLSTMRYVDAVVGNSSSGILEAPSFKIGTINIGDRQKGRIRAGSVIDCPPVKEDIELALRTLYSREFQMSLKDTVNPHGDGYAAQRIMGILRKADLAGSLKKTFYNLPAMERE